MWVLAKMSSACSNDIAQRILRSLFRRTLLEKPGVGETAFVRTHYVLDEHLELKLRPSWALGGGLSKEAPS